MAQYWQHRRKRRETETSPALDVSAAGRRVLGVHLFDLAFLAGAVFYCVCRNEKGRSRSCREFLPKRHILTGSVRCGINGRNPAIKIRLALLPEMRRQNKDTDTTAHGIRGFSSVLPKVQIYLCDLLPRRENGRNQNARRLDAVQTGESVCTAFICVRGTNEHFRRNR